ncbi:MAG: hypothetical protein R3E76_09845 [Planctomycetota bacterium]
MMICALIGWMPSAFDISIWHSLWTLARRRETGVAPSVRNALVDFNVGYIGTAILAICFIFMGASVMFHSGKEFAAAPPAFAAQIIQLYTENLGAWTGPVVTISAFAVMFSTTLTVVDGFPRALLLDCQGFGPKSRDVPDTISRKAYWVSLGTLCHWITCRDSVLYESG